MQQTPQRNRRGQTQGKHNARSARLNLPSRPDRESPLNTQRFCASQNQHSTRASITEEEEKKKENERGSRSAPNRAQYWHVSFGYPASSPSTDGITGSCVLSRLSLVKPPVHGKFTPHLEEPGAFEFSGGGHPRNILPLLCKLVKSLCSS